MRLGAGAIGLGFLAAACAQTDDTAAADNEKMSVTIVTAPKEHLASEEHIKLMGSCTAAASAEWWARPNVQNEIRAFTAGDDCEKAVAVLTIHNADGDLIWTDAFATNQVFYLQYAQTADEMKAALQEWIDPELNTRPAGDALVEWPLGADEPTPGAEFPFYPEPGYERPYYEELRKSDAVLFCYTQGMESSMCLEGDESAVYPVGLQLFPG